MSGLSKALLLKLLLLESGGVMLRALPSAMGAALEDAPDDIAKCCERASKERRGDGRGVNGKEKGVK